MTSLTAEETHVYYHPITDRIYTLVGIAGGLILYSDIEGGFWMTDDWLKEFVFLGEL